MKIISGLLFLFSHVNCGLVENFLQNTCKNDFKEIKDTGVLWRMYDASTKIPSGILTEGTSDFGNFEECLEITTNTSKGLVIGKYCLYLAKINSYQNESIYLQNALCVPNTCELPKPKGNDDFIFDEIYCQTKDTFTDWTTLDLFASIYFLSLFLMVIIGTMYEVTKGTNKDNKNRYFLAFSLKSNVKSIFKIDRSDNQIGCFNPLRVFCILMIILGHIYAGVSLMSLKNPKDFKDRHPYFIFSGHWTLETFFVMSSFLISYSNFKNSARNALTITEIPKFYIKRILRFIPVIYSLLLLGMTFWRKFTSGPDWPYTITTYTKDCSKGFWKYLLFIQNYGYNQCLGHTWYVNAELQLFLLSPLILIPATYLRTKNIKYGYIFMTITTVVSFVVPFIFDFVFSEHNIYLTHKHLFAFCVGFLLGMIKVDLPDSPIKLNKIMVILVWILLVGIITGASCRDIYKLLLSPKYSIEHHSFFSFSYMASSLLTFWIIFTCLNEKEGLLNRVLSWKGFQPLAKLTFSMYLLHYLLIYPNYAYSKTPITFSYTLLFYSFCTNIILTAMFSLVWMLVIEMPFAQLQNLVFSRMYARHVQNKMERCKS